MEMYKTENAVFVSVTNIADFDALIKTAEAQVQELKETFAKLARFDLRVEFSVKNDHA